VPGQPARVTADLLGLGTFHVRLLRHTEQVDLPCRDRRGAGLRPGYLTCRVEEVPDRGKSVAPASPAGDDLSVLANLWPLFGLTVQTSRLRLRLPYEQEITELASIAGRGVHHPGERPFLTPWTAGDPQDRARFVLQEHWSQLGTWNASAWRLGLGVFLGEQPLGIVTLRARDFLVVREVTTSSWLGLPHHGKGYGTEACAGLLTLAFDH